MIMIWPLTCLIFGLIGLGWMKMLVLGLFLLLVWKSIWQERLFGLIMLLRCGLFFVSAMSPLVSRLILPPYVKNNCYSRVTVQLRISFDSYLQYGVSLTLLVLSCPRTLVTPAGSNRATLSFVAPMTS
jgi:hypothetical protein